MSKPGLPSGRSNQKPIKKGDDYWYRGYKMTELDGTWFVEDGFFIYKSLERAMVDVDVMAIALQREVIRIEEDNSKTQ